MALETESSLECRRALFRDIWAKTNGAGPADDQTRAQQSKLIRTMKVDSPYGKAIQQKMKERQLDCLKKVCRQLVAQSDLKEDEICFTDSVASVETGTCSPHSYKSVKNKKRKKSRKVKRKNGEQPQISSETKSETKS